MQFPVQRQLADFERLKGALPWRDFANGEIPDNGGAAASGGARRRHAPHQVFQPNIP
jgi:hypothetical protein